MSEETTRADVPAEEPEREFRFRDYAIEDYVVLVVFWVLAGVVFAQFFSRYVLNASIVWTEEMARYLLIAVGFLGATMAVRKRTHIYVEIFYRVLPAVVGRVLSTLVDVIKIVFFSIGSVLSWRVIPIMRVQRMVTVPWSMAVIYVVVLIGFTIMTIRSALIAWEHWKSGYIPVINDPTLEAGSEEVQS